MSYTEEIYNILHANATPMTATEISRAGKVGDRSYVSKNLSKLVERGVVSKKREPRGVVYWLTGMKIALDEKLSLKGLSENDVWAKIEKDKNHFLDNGNEKSIDILEFAFTEMLNNAIDHSKSGIGDVKVWRERGYFRFIVRDYGIGIFNGVMAKKGFESEKEALQEILKGKLTTDPINHSGEGVFWTTKIADKVSYTSYGLRLTIDNLINDYAIEVLDEEESVIGTEVYFEISEQTEKSIYEVFKHFSLEETGLKLDTTVIPVKLFDGGEVWISRSQAKRILKGLDKYKKIVIDFKDIRLIGQGFADEIFRVYQLKHPELQIEAINMNESVKFMVQRAKNDPTGRN